MKHGIRSYKLKISDTELPPNKIAIGLQDRKTQSVARACVAVTE